MIFNVEYTDSGIEQRINSLMSLLNNTQPTLTKVGVALKEIHEQRFVRMIDPDSQPWKPLSPLYLKRKPVNKDKILTLYGKLKGSLVSEVEVNKVTTSVDTVYANVHQWGWPEKNIPARPYMGINSENEAALLSIVEEAVARTLR